MESSRGSPFETERQRRLGSLLLLAQEKSRKIRVKIVKTLIWAVVIIMLLFLALVSFMLYLEWCIGAGHCRA